MVVNYCHNVSLLLFRSAYDLKSYASFTLAVFKNHMTKNNYRTVQILYFRLPDFYTGNGLVIPFI